MIEKEQISLHGRLVIDVLRQLPNGEIKFLEHIEQDNLVVSTGRNAVARLLGGDRTSGIAKFGVGTGSTTPVAADTTLTGIFLKAIQGKTYPATGKCYIQWQLGTGDAVGMNIREFGLFFGDDVMFARLVRAGAIFKAADMVLNGEWQITT